MIDDTVILVAIITAYICLFIQIESVNNRLNEMKKLLEGGAGNDKP